MHKVHYIFLLYFLLSSGSIQGQDSINELISKPGYSLHDTTRVNILNTVANQNQYVKSEKIYEYATKALYLSEDINYEKGIAESYINLGIFYRSKGVYDESLDYFYSSLKIMEQINFNSGIAQCYYLIGTIYYFLKNNDLSLDYYEKALNLNSGLHDRKWISGIFNSIGMVYESKGDLEKALKYYIKSLDSNIKLSDSNWIAVNYGNIGTVYQKQKKFDKALEYFQNKLEIYEELNNQSGISSTNVLIGNYYSELNQYKKAIPYFINSYEIANNEGLLLTLNSSSEGISNAYAILGIYDKALQYHKIFKNNNDSFRIAEINQRITRLDIQNEFRKEQSIAALKYQKTEYYFITIAIGLFLLILVAVILFSRQRANEKHRTLGQKKLNLENSLLQEELEFKEILLQDNVKFLVDKNKLITDVSNDLIDSIKSFKSENQDLVNEVIIDIQSSIDNDVWEEFEISFKQVHSQFYNNLSKRYPDLTTNDKKLCAFLKMNMNSKEISAIMKQSVTNIETARTRLRKKLNISNKNIGLAEHLSQF